jgi:glutaminase
MLALALGKLGDRLWSRVGREPSGHSFDSMLLLELERVIRAIRSSTQAQL